MLAMGLDTYEKYKKWSDDINSPEFIAEMKRKYTHIGWSFKTMVRPGKPGGYIATSWSCANDPNCGACQNEREIRKNNPWYR
jgi:hypothetical protein